MNRGPKCSVHPLPAFHRELFASTVKVGVSKKGGRERGGETNVLLDYKWREVTQLVQVLAQNKCVHLAAHGMRKSCHGWDPLVLPLFFLPPFLKWIALSCEWLAGRYSSKPQRLPANSKVNGKASEVDRALEIRRILLVNGGKKKKNLEQQSVTKATSWTPHSPWDCLWNVEWLTWVRC